MLISVPNVSEGTDRGVIAAIGEAFAPARLLDVHCDEDHNRSVYTLAGKQGELAAALTAGAVRARELIDLSSHVGIHPHVGIVDVVPLVHLSLEDRGAACAEALTAGEMIARATGAPVFLYGRLAGGRERAALRAGGACGLARRIATGEQRPDFGPSEIDPAVGATLLAARPPLVAFNVDLAAGETLEKAREVAAELRESGGGLPGVRAIGLYLESRGSAQVSCNVHDPLKVPLAEIVEFVRARATIENAELVGLAPQAALIDFPDDLPMPGFDPETRLLERVLARPG
jgi:glutamate formiminotransferase/glutamate formiminotransferase/formiminotetrahydrofolate cyclodeaminase